MSVATYPLVIVTTSERLPHIRTFHPRRGRMGDRHRDALDRLLPVYGVPVTRQPLDLDALFGRRLPVVLEIGSGMGEATADMAAADPERGYLAVDVHTPGVANLLALVEERGLTNVRIALGDALEVVDHQLAPRTVDAIHVFFPDPWPKARHHKRRLIQPRHVALLRSRLVPGGTLHCATDSADYAAAMLETLSGDPELGNAYDDYAPRPGYRPLTKFEQRGVDAGRDVFDLIFTRR
ncbi:tRNA (guanosine(46)-N7)-methyltransferase TrmB [Planosporangium thailandense]|uniref:tRNA (guanine-N(7)-)-methyltransferase n=1 Tax=Planosporangium thailandense TaxID=765197 RepID=A0ABX0XR53_9ACTN|nr:tRNA (guanosine(46)-N7)-methyltransferase TrmB [Planosporangium thailandense]